MQARLNEGTEKIMARRCVTPRDRKAAPDSRRGSKRAKAGRVRWLRKQKIDREEQE